jgi:hypothetical protein
LPKELTVDDAPGKKKEKSPAKAGSHDVDLTPHPLVTKLLPDLDHPHEAVVLVGYLGHSKTPDLIRLYPDLDFQTYIEIPKSAIINHSQVQSPSDVEPTKLVVDAKAPLEFVQCRDASVLQGAIASRFPVGRSKPGGVVKSRACPLCMSGPVINTH